MQQICEKCGKVNSVDATRCMGCNADLIVQDSTVILSAAASAAARAVSEPGSSSGLASRFNTCPTCSTVNVVNAMVCRACGQPLASGVKASSVTQTSLEPVSDLDDTKPHIPLKELGTASNVGASKGKKRLLIALGLGGFFVAAAIGWLLLSGPADQHSMPAKPNPFALPPEAMVSAPAVADAPAQTSAVIPSQDTAPLKNESESLPAPSVAQTLDPKETIVPPSTPSENTVRSAVARDAPSKQAAPVQQEAGTPSKKDTRASDATRTAAQPAPARTTNTAPAREIAAARPSAAANSGSAPANGSAEPPAAGQSAPAVQASSPKEVCGTRFVLLQPFCMQEQCGLPRFTNHAQCVQMRAQQREMQQRMEDRN